MLLTLLEFNRHAFLALPAILLETLSFRVPFFVFVLFTVMDAAFLRVKARLPPPDHRDHLSTPASLETPLKKTTAPYGYLPGQHLSEATQGPQKEAAEKPHGSARETDNTGRRSSRGNA